ncbi:hypothetical protein NLJ89_g10505 [Agrocybe chaxingu]|uniref:Protein kinase domain-containing protein n=1 Tax=Agrocybe chaxingu TaxID=84603 RepID=A0A9W8JRM1_9AGAR|nr:hypothetical protein NLJ89_g10505 [Agrocybe chaxingu]
MHRYRAQVFSNDDNESSLGSPVFVRPLEDDYEVPYNLKHEDNYYRPELGLAERCWVDRFKFFQERGFVFRPRYRPGWTPSWISSGKNWSDCEDHLIRLHAHIVDAKRKSDGLPVVVKQVYRTNTELEVMRLFSSVELSHNPANHVVQLIDIFMDQDDPDMGFLVMPLLKRYDDPAFGVVGEVVDFVTQVLEGLAFIHSHNVAHNDCTGNNIMMDARPIFPNRWHPVSETYSPDYASYARSLSRIDHPVRYYFIDFGLSHRFQPGQQHVVMDYGGADHDVPELETAQPYDPFRVDVYTLGNIFMKKFRQKYVGLDFLGDLVDYMRIDKPRKRPTAQMTLDFWLRIKTGLDPRQARWRLRTPTESIPEHVVLDAVAAARIGIHEISKYFI